MRDEDVTESDISEASDGALETANFKKFPEVRPTADADIAGDANGDEPGYTFPGPGA